MKAYETSTTVEQLGEIHIAGVPFAPGTEVAVVISPKRKSAAEFAAAWQQFCGELRQQPQSASLTDENIQQEIDSYRRGR